VRVVFDIIHPADVHLFRRTIGKLLVRGDAVLVASRDKDVTLNLLDDAGIAHRIMSRKLGSTADMALELLQRNLRLWRAARRFGPDLFVSSNSASASQVARLMGKPSLVFDDTEINRLMRLLYKPFATEIHTPGCYRLSLGRKHRRYSGYHSLAYLRSDHLTPDQEALARHGISSDERLVLVRFVSHATVHDLGGDRLSPDRKRALVSALAAQARVLVSSETPLPPDLAPLSFSGAPADLHHLVGFACLLLGESATMASEAAALGTPSILIDEQGRGYTDELESRYGLCTRLRPRQWEQALERASDILSRGDPRNTFAQAHARLLEDTVDVSDYQVAQIDRIARQGGKTSGSEVSDRRFRPLPRQGFED